MQQYCKKINVGLHTFMKEIETGDRHWTLSEPSKLICV